MKYQVQPALNFYFTEGAGYTIEYQDLGGPATAQAPYGTVDATFPTQAAAIADSHGAFIDIVHNGGPIGIQFFDIPFDDNLGGVNPPDTSSTVPLWPTFRLGVTPS